VNSLLISPFIGRVVPRHIGCSKQQHQLVKSKKYILRRAEIINKKILKSFWWIIYVGIVEASQHTGSVISWPLGWWYPSPKLNRINRVSIPTRCIFFFGSLSRKNLQVKRAWLGTIWNGWPIGKFFSGSHEWGQSAHKRLVLVCGDNIWS
jgi:hypothetical protein